MLASQQVDQQEIVKTKLINHKFSELLVNCQTKERLLLIKFFIADLLPFLIYKLKKFILILDLLPLISSCQLTSAICHFQLSQPVLSQFNLPEKQSFEGYAKYAKLQIKIIKH